MTDAIADALLLLMGDVHANADGPFDLDTALRVLENTNAMLQGASRAERKHLAERAEALAAQGGNPERVQFFEIVVADMRESTLDMGASLADESTLLNKINSISAKDPEYAKRLERGYKLLRKAGYVP